MVGGGEGMGKLEATMEQLDEKLHGTAQVNELRKQSGILDLRCETDAIFAWDPYSFARFRESQHVVL